MKLAEILSEMQKKPTSLFYGAGVCLDCGGPSGSQLFDAITQQFPGGNSTDFFEYLKEIIDFDNTNRNEIEAAIKQSLSLVSPRDEQKYLFSLPWKAIITTNYDRLPNLIVKTIDSRRLVVPVVNPETDFPIDPSKPDSLFCFKLLGDVDFSYPKGGWMVLSANDLKIAFDRRSMFFRMFHSLSATGHIVYIGYSFKDNIVFDLLQEMKFVLRTFPWKGFAILPEEPDKSTAAKMEKMGITWVRGTLREFIDEAKKIFGLIPTSASSIVNQFEIHHFPMRLERATVDNTWRKFKLFDATFLEPFSKEPQHFFEGIDKSFYPFVAGWDFPRRLKKIYIDDENSEAKYFDVENFVEKRTQDGNSSHNIMMALIGSAGSGKTVVANRIAFNWYQSGNPVIFIEPETMILDKMALDGLLDEIWEKYRTETTKKKLVKPPALRFLLIADDCGAMLEQLVDLRSHLRGIGKPADILLVTRTSDLPINRIKRAKTDVIMAVDDTVEKDEWADFISHFEEKGVLDRGVLTSNLKDPSINTSFFALTFTCVRGVQKPLRDIITDEFESLDLPSRNVYATVSLLQSQLLTPLTSLTLAVGKINREWLDSEMEKGRLGGILSLRKGGYEMVAPNRIIAEIVSQLVYRTPEQLFLALKDIVKAVELGNRLEMTLLHLLMTERLRGELGNRLRPEQKISLFNDAVNVVRSRPLLLHLAMLQTQSDRFEEANLTLREAFSAHIPDFDEPEQHIMDAKGRLELRVGEQAAAKNNKVLAWDHFEKAEQLFYDAQISPAVTPHSYQGLGRTFVDKAKIADDEETRWLYLLLAMQECVYAEKYLGGEFNPGIALLKQEVLRLLDHESLDETKIARIKVHIGKAAAFAFLAEKEIRRSNYSKAVELVQKGLREDPISLWLIRLNVMLIKKKAPEDLENIKRALQDYLRIENKRFDVPLSFELAMTTFKSGDTRTALHLFKELDERTKDHPMRLTQDPENRWTEKGELKEFFGTLIEVPTFGKYGKIECTSLPGFRGPISVRKQDIEGTFHGGERVSFGIIFNMVGPQATRVRRYTF